VQTSFVAQSRQLSIVLLVVRGTVRFSQTFNNCALPLTLLTRSTLLRFFSRIVVNAGYLLASGVLTPKGPQDLLNMHRSGTPVLFSQPQDVLTISRPAGKYATIFKILEPLWS